MEPWEIMISESPGADGRRCPAGAASTASKRCASAGSSPLRRSARSRTPASCAATSTPSGRSDPRGVPDRGGAAVRGSADTPAPAEVRAPKGPANDEALLELLRSPNIRSRAWIYRRYDHLVGSRTVRRPGLDAAVLRLRPSFRGLAVSLDGSGRICRLDPRTGGAAAVLEAAPQRRLRGRRAARLHGLPQLRQSRARRDRLGARRGDRGDRRGLRGARRSDRLRQRLALQRDRRPADLPDTRGRLRRARRRRAPRPGPLARGRRRLPRRPPGHLSRRLRVPGALRRGRRPARAARPRGRGGA